MPAHGRQLALFTCGVTGKLRPLDFDLVPDQFVVGLHRHQFPRGHGERSGQEPSHACKTYGAPARAGARHP